MLTVSPLDKGLLFWEKGLACNVDWAGYLSTIQSPQDGFHGVLAVNERKCTLYTVYSPVWYSEKLLLGQQRLHLIVMINIQKAYKLVLRPDS